MNISELFTTSKNPIFETMIKINKQTIPELRALAKEQGYYKLHKSKLFLFVLRTINQEMPIPPPRTNNHKRRSVHPVKIIRHQKEINKFEEQEMAKSTPVVKSKQSEWYD